MLLYISRSRDKLKSKTKMKLEIILIALISLYTVKEATGKVTGDLLKVEEGGSGSDDTDAKNETLVNSIEKINGGTKDKKVVLIDFDTEGSGSGAPDVSKSVIVDDTDDGSADEGSGSGDYSKISSTSQPFRINTNQKNSSVVVINVGSTVAAVLTTQKSEVTTVVAGEDSTPVPMTTKENDLNTVDQKVIVVQPDDEISPVASSSDEVDEEDSGVNFTVAIVVGVVVGAILSILIIVFLVYRLRKKDEGSYSLDEPSSAMLPADSPHPKEKGDHFA